MTAGKEAFCTKSSAQSSNPFPTLPCKVPPCPSHSSSTVRWEKIGDQMGLLNCDNQLTSIIVLLRSKSQSRLSQANSSAQEAPPPYLDDPHERTSSLFSKKEF